MDKIHLKESDPNSDEYKKWSNAKFESKIKKDKSNEKKWHDIINKTKTVNILSYSYNLITGVQRYWQRMPGVNTQDAACGPTSGAMIVDYLTNQQTRF
ncbi:hypothetical protein [Ferviditalea candida]|uniref:Peptidase C39-like domain-containing protein n=1 Tax=Ferviditalea candida TaxID=3108399 RepID=A0ABU5ZET3_9BACL|nr:hypothetical protein [Paenibacillaceae bacterium T2]